MTLFFYIYLSFYFYHSVPKGIYKRNSYHDYV